MPPKLIASTLAYLRLCCGRGSRRYTKGPFNPLIATAWDLQELLQGGQCTSVEIVQICINQIHKHDGYLKAVIVIAKDAIEQAQRLDTERKSGRLRGPLHGIPILIKACISPYHHVAYTQQVRTISQPQRLIWTRLQVAWPWWDRVQGVTPLWWTSFWMQALSSWESPSSQ